MGRSTKCDIGGDLHGLPSAQASFPSLPIYLQLLVARLERFTRFLRIYGFEGGAPEEGEVVTRIPESKRGRQPCDVVRDGQG